jgi:hypothetical protein
MLGMCKYKTYRSNKGIKQAYCRLKREWIPECSGCQNKQYKDYKPLKSNNNPLKKQSSKQRKMETHRFSLFTEDMDHCIECGKIRNDKHEIFRGSNRHNSIKHGLVIPFCRECHENPEILKKWEIKGQEKFVELNGLEEFIKVFKIDFINRRTKNEINH